MKYKLSQLFIDAAMKTNFDATLVPRETVLAYSELLVQEVFKELREAKSTITPVGDIYVGLAVDEVTEKFKFSED